MKIYWYDTFEDYVFEIDGIIYYYNRDYLTRVWHWQPDFYYSELMELVAEIED